MEIGRKDHPLTLRVADRREDGQLMHTETSVRSQVRNPEPREEQRNKQKGKEPMIYNDNTAPRKRDENGYIVTNWNPNLDYGTEHVNIHFRIHTKGYEYPSFSFSKEDRTAFEADIRNIFTHLGWKCENEAYNGTCSTWKKGHAHLYMHPQDFSGEVLKNEVRLIAETIAERAKSLSLASVDLYGTSYVMTEEEYQAALTAKNPEIRRDILTVCQTKRRSNFILSTDIAWNLAAKHRILRAGNDDGRNYGQRKTFIHIGILIQNLIDEGYLIEHKEPNSIYQYIRTINKTEQKQKKLFIN